MSVDKFLYRNQMIADYLQQLSQQREHMHWDGVLHPVNPLVREMFQAQERLITALERVLDTIPTQRIAA
jgi:mannose/fructose/N-acetylgalactosamine-specific phosphotransferase system component IID